MNTSRFFIILLTMTAAAATSSCRPDSGPSAAERAYQGLVDQYLKAWTTFYPTRAVRLGLHEHLAEAEDRSAGTVAAWMELNQSALDSLKAEHPPLSVDLRIDLRLLENRIHSEMATWDEGSAIQDSPSLYAAGMADLLDIPAEPRGFDAGDLESAVANRLTALETMARDLQSQLEEGKEAEISGAARSLDRLDSRLDDLALRFPSLEGRIVPARDAVRDAVSYLADSLESTPEPETPSMSRGQYALEMGLYYGMPMNPLEVAQRALDEMDTVRSLIAEVSKEYWEETYPQTPIPGDMMEMVTRVSADMEKNRSSSEEEALETFTRFAREAEAFVAEKGIATLPEDRTLRIQLTPESAGPMQRIGFVDSPPPFDPDPMTVLSIPTIPDSFPEAEKEDFYRSFNNHFNKAIIIHELFPGHYMQLKLASQNPRRIRSFFPYEPYIEGWATLVEAFALNAGWDDYNKLTYLAHLRKRLENANRAYTSVQVYMSGWDEEQVRAFSRENALLAPQFAESLWGRLLRDPIQMTSYFMGKEMFRDVLEAEKERLGYGFDLRRFNDVILRAGAIPLDMVPELLAQSPRDGEV